MSKLSLSAGLNLCHFIWRRTATDYGVVVASTTN